MLHSFINRLTGRTTGRHTPSETRTAPAPDSQRTGHPTQHAPGNATNHQIHRAIDRAIELGLLDHAERIVRSVLRSGSIITPQLIERIARLHLIRGRSVEALQTIETACEETSSLRMLRIACLIMIGRRLDAHLELHRWSKHNTCPLEARCMLALLDEEHGYTDDAQRELMKNIRQLNDPQAIELLAIICASHNRRELAEVWINRLCAIVQSRTAALSPRLLAESLDVPFNASIVPTQENIESLSTELLVSEPAIPALVTAQELEPERNIAHLLYCAIETALPELSRRDAAIESLARLALVLDQHEVAMKWLEMAMDENRITAGMARIARELTAADHKAQHPSTTDQAGDRNVIGRIEDALRTVETHNESEDDAKWKRAA